MSVSGYCERLGQLKTIRAMYEPHWAECYKFGCPERMQSFTDSSQNSQANNQNTARNDLLDSTAAEAIQLLVASTMSATTPSNSIWFQPVLDGQDNDVSFDDGEKWLEEAAKIVWRNIHAANFDSEALEAMTDAVVAGWMALYIDVDRDKGGYVFEAWPISNCYIASTRADGVVDTIFREYELTAAQIVNEYPDTASEKVRKAAETTPDEKIQVIHVIEPRKGKTGNMLAKTLPFASHIIEVSTKTELQESGYHEFPVAVSRWRRIPNSVYANGQMSIALPDAKTANKLMEITLQSAELAVGGMWIAEDDGVLNPATVRIGPRRVVVANSVDSMKSLTTGADFQVSEMLLGKIQGGIRKKLMSDQLQPVDGPAMTATEVHVRVDLIRQQLGPIYSRQLSEYCHPTLDRCFGLALRAGALGTPPESLQGRTISYKYLSPLARAQSMEEVTAIERMAAGLQAMQAIEPTVTDNIDFDAAIQITGKGLGVPASVLRSSESRAQLRQDRADTQQAQQEQAQQQQTVQMAGQAVADKFVKTPDGAAA